MIHFINPAVLMREIAVANKILYSVKCRLVISKLAIFLGCFGFVSSYGQTSLTPDSVYSKTPVLDKHQFSDEQIISAPHWTWKQASDPDCCQKTGMTVLLKKSIVPTALFMGSVASWNSRKDFQQLRNQYTPSFHNRFDDYLQYGPAITVLSLKLAGVKGKYTFKRTITSYAFSAVIMAALTNTLKYSSRINRPDGTARNSFPSGHTANAFMNATFLHQEYGNRSMMYSIGGYTSAALTATGRQLNNRHWVSDIFAGAAIGILSAEVGNYLAGRLMKPDQLQIPRLWYADADRFPSGFMSLRMDYRVPLMKQSSELFLIKPGRTIAIDGGWYVNQFAGIGAELIFFAHPVVRNVEASQPFSSYFGSAETGVFTGKFLRGGPIFRQYIRSDWTVESRLMLGVLSVPSAVDLSDTHARYEIKKSFSWGVGIALQKKFDQHLGIKTYLAYDSETKILISSHPDNHLGADKQKPIKFPSLSFGLGLSALF
ncbi:phosphatase PAP2 family protein [Pedobacter sp. MR22-3]|uniref:phosphatase PAP2 family protein n=1 Tax=Pedobacter sp. MR22-3 TaxID=2994552 RepID=UPI0022485C3A|nr:phosphatase PAP2 family protein [Pedobacter sp. MR22-3]MCX2584738.1 phosphatase PAP2 family protein [Pedobacter sp. MR22-3]